ncbi:hypothetical protein L5515_003215 [Caenorhabditis briggsae]|uniref:Uncharacterized protein n=1 Tax=Caenorhabditis briggsae TaxID=6238 RepID=A0AAE9J9B6_CAEBR|nr:hypothetical protein L5515_003215 [Caenorhabditis briggsae]
MYRFANGQNLDTYAQLIYDKYLKKFYFRKKKEFSGTSNDKEFKIPPLILNHLYEISEDLKTISPVFWKGKSIFIERVVYSTGHKECDNLFFEDNFLKTQLFNPNFW